MRQRPRKRRVVTKQVTQTTNDIIYSFQVQGVEFLNCDEIDYFVTTKYIHKNIYNFGHGQPSHQEGIFGVIGIREL